MRVISTSDGAIGLGDHPFWKRVGWLTLGQTMEKGGHVALVVLLVRLLAPQRWNVMALSLSVYLAAVTIGSFNLEQSVLFYLPRLDQRRQSALIVRTSYLLGVVGLCLGVSIMIVGRVTGVFGNGAAPLLIGVAVALEMPSVIAGPVLILRGRTTAAGMWDSFQAILQCVAVIAPAALGMSNTAMLSGLAMASAVRLGGYLVVLPEVLRASRHHADRSLVLEQLLFCAPLGLAMAAGTLARVADKWIVAWHLPATIGTYAVAVQEIPLLSVLPYAGGAAIAVALVDHLRNGDADVAHELWVRQAEFMCRLVVPLVVAMVVLAPEGFALLFGTGYSSAVVPFQIFTVVGVHRVTEYGVVLRAAGRTREVVISSLVLLVANVALGIPAVKIGGVLGLTLASVAAFAIAWWWILGRVANVFNRTRSKVFPWGTWITRVVIYSLIGLVLMMVSRHVEGYIARALLKTTGMAGAVGAVEWFSRLAGSERVFAPAGPEI